ncbi:diguanylate cyclase (GGDEF) domain-containing protein [Desulfomicrobium apsheronum]|uniref:diguanylate cyclase n=1 Tax=Desulfomicrobium apsheronum TaxID=52560 RepID=A0A1I3PH52_9BACT|nr:diguanylate cyclase [Desulfomicrobium apsheronum]SFJ21004.1 diguanylate cyclase (GGDEF) domain-containing protein [Desulfomicrobium apsheronum]
MKLIARQKIRFYYYLSGIVAIIFIAASMSAPYFLNLKKEYQSKTEQLSQSIISEKKRHLYDVVNRTILEIEFIKTDTAREYNEICAEVSNILFTSHAWKEPILDESLLNVQNERIQDSTRKNINNIISFIVYDTKNSHVVGSSDDNAAEIFARTVSLNANNRELYPAIATAISNEGFSIYVFVSRDTFETNVKNRIKDLIRAVRLGDDGYIWINEIINYDGGDDYAIRLVHPNLPHTEGLKLSTKMQDINGDFPYKTELDGVKINGDLYFDYYFKKMNTDNISHKLTYAKLYKPYNWVIATGVYLDDVDNLVIKEQQSMDKTYKNQIQILGFVIFCILVISFSFLVAFEKHINGLISSYVETIEKKEKSLRLEKDKVEKAFGKLKDVAYLDYLTGLWNRRSMYERLTEEYSRCSRNDSSFVIILGDIDHFKVINDTHGHGCGDIVLKQLSKIMSKNIRNEDSVSRWGGEEFLILGTSCNLADGVSLAEKVRSAIEHKEISFDNITLNVTMTLGVSAFDPKKSIDEIIKEADAMLYFGKNNGRNCVISTMSST